MSAARKGGRPARRRRFGTVFGVDFSGARLAGRTTWVAKAVAQPRRRGESDPRLRLTELASLERICGTAERGASMAALVRAIGQSRGALWAIDAPFGLPVEVRDAQTASWWQLLRFVRGWKQDGYDLGLWALARADALGGPRHIFRATDRAARAPFDAYHYRIIYQTYHAMRDVLWPLRRVQGTVILPFQYARLASARRVVMETCPGSTLKRLGLPHQNYKQPEGGPLTARRKRTRREILAGLERHIEIPAQHRLRIARDPGGDALDAVIAAVGGSTSFAATDHAAVGRDSRFRREGFLYF
ncbi:MAG TPA: hypothetical protein VKA84_11745 [Gemmatimonadaceae bacterium]|nr:hypothetical protein [Gemmatimonadaceae bacterium]